MDSTPVHHCERKFPIGEVMVLVVIFLCRAGLWAGAQGVQVARET